MDRDDKIICKIRKICVVEKILNLRFKGWYKSICNKGGIGM